MLYFGSINNKRSINAVKAEYEREYVTRHKKIRDRLAEAINDCDCGCVSVPKIASELGMDERTVRSHLRIMEMDNVGAFLDPDGKAFCTKDGIIQLAEGLGLEVKERGQA